MMIIALTLALALQDDGADPYRQGIESEWQEIRERLNADLGKGEWPAARSALAEMEALVALMPSHEALRRDYDASAIALLDGDADPQARKDLAARILRLPASDDPLSIRLHARAALELNDFPDCMEDLARLPDDADTAALRKRFEAAAPGRIKRLADLKKEYGATVAVYRCEGRDAATPTVAAWLKISQWGNVLPVLGIIYREGSVYRLDLQLGARRIAAADLGESFPADAELLARVEAVVDANGEWDIAECHWTTEVFFRDYESWRKAVELERAQDYAGAGAVYGAILERRPGLYEALAHRLDLSRKTGDWKAVLHDAELILEGSPTRKRALEDVREAHAKLKDPAVLDDDCRLIALQPSNYYTYLERSRYRRTELNDLKGALADMTQAAELASWMKEDLYKERAELRRALGQTAEAIEDYTQALNKSPSWELYFARSALRRGLGDAAGADEDYRRGCDLPLEKDWDYQYRASFREKLGDLKGAIDDYFKADRQTRVPATLADLGRFRAKIHEKMGDLESAAHELDRAAMLNPSWSLCMEAADMWRRAGVEANALDNERRAIQAPLGGADKVPSEGFAERASGRLWAKDWDGAIEDCGRALEAARNEIERSKRLMERARTRYSVGDPAGALADADQSLKIEDGWEIRMFRAQILWDLGRDAEAKEELAKAAAIPIDGAEAQDRGERRAKFGDLEGALAAYSARVKSAGPYGLGWALASRARCLLAMGRIDEACRDFAAAGTGCTDDLAWALEVAGKPDGARRARGKYLDNPDAGSWETQGIVRALLAEGAFDRAIEFIERGLKQTSDMEDRKPYLSLKVDALAAKGDLKGAIETLPAPSTFEEFFRRADLRVLAGDEAGARADFASALALDLHSDPARLEARARLRLSHGDPAGAAEDCARAIAVSRPASRPDLRLLRADCLARAGDMKGALAEWEEAIKARPTWEAYLGRAAARRRAGDEAGANADIEKAASMPCRADELVDRARKRAEAGDRAGADRDCSRALDLNGNTPASHWTWLNRWFFRLELGREAEAQADVEKALRLARLESRESYARALLNVAFLRWRVGRSEDAARDVKEAAALDRRGGALALRGLLLKRTADLDEALRADPREIWTVKIVARGRSAVGDAGGAESAARRALEIDSTDAEAWALLAEALASRDKAAARQALDRAASLDPEGRDLKKDIDRVRAAIGR